MKSGENSYKQQSGSKQGRSRILYEITALVVVVLIVSGLITFFLVRGSQENLIDESKEKVIETEMENISSFFDYISTAIAPEIVQRSIAIPWETHIEAFATGGLTEVQEYTIDILKDMVEGNTLAVDTYMIVITKWKTIPNEMVYACNDTSLIYEWDVPAYLVEAIEQDQPYLYQEDGIPELNRGGDYLVVLRKLEDPALDYVAALVGFKPMATDIAAISDFYNQESKKISITLGLVVGISIIVIIIITFLVLNYLIRKRITQPIEELSASAEEVMDGNLDVEIKVREGSEFEGLVRAFKEMLDSIRRLIDQSVSEK
jgi:methyl-accepting chemotaxis protein